MSQRKFSIITINYNNKEGLRKTIESVVGQSFRDFEYIIIDGGSTDGSIEVIKEYAGKVDYWVSEPDKGIYHAMNKGVLQAHGEYLNFMNSGDEFYNNGVLQEVAPSLDSDIVVGKIVHGTEVWGFHKEDITLMDLIRGTVLHQASFFRKELFDENRYDYNPQIQISAESETKRSIFREKDKTKRSKKESAQHSKSRNKSFVMTSVSAL